MGRLAHATLGLAALAFSNLTLASDNDKSDKWDQLLQGITIEESIPEEVNPPSKTRPKHIRSNYQGLEKPAAPVKGTSGQTAEFHNDSRAASAEAVDAEMQMMTENINDLIPEEPKPIPIDVPPKPIGVRLITLSKGNIYNGAIHEKLKFKIDVNNPEHTKYMMAYLASRGQDGWTWEQKNQIQNATISGPSYTELEVWLKKPTTEEYRQP